MYDFDINYDKDIESKISGIKSKVKTSHAAHVDFLFAKTTDYLEKIAGFLQLLSEKELLQAERFRFDSDRSSYIVSHGLLRQLLGEKLDIPPASVSFVYGKHNKPELVENTCYFNISHTRHAFAIAISDERPVGIDIEKINKNDELNGVMETVFCNNEKEYVRSKIGMEAECFTLIWTRKEALLKAFGLGIVDEIKDIDVSGTQTLQREIFDDYGVDILSDHLSIHSEINDSYFLSLAAWGNIKANQMNLG